jgi:hypothetical protein
LSTPQPPDSPRIGVDEWVSSAEGRRERGRAGRIEDAFARVPPVAKLAVLAVPFALYPFLVDSDYLMQVGIDTLIFVLLALGLNVAVGWVGLLDLGSSVLRPRHTICRRRLQYAGATGRRSCDP